MLSVGTKAPDFSLPDQNGNIISLDDFKGQKVLLFFYSKDNTSGCTKQAVGYSDLVDDYMAKGVKVIGISKDSVASHKKFETNHDLKITVLSDTDRSVIEAYDVWKEKKMCGKVSMGVLRTTYIIDEEGVIIYANDKVKAADDPGKMITCDCLL